MVLCGGCLAEIEPKIAILGNPYDYWACPDCARQHEKSITSSLRRSAVMKECNECFAYGRHESWCDKTR